MRYENKIDKYYDYFIYFASALVETAGFLVAAFGGGTTFAHAFEGIKPAPLAVASVNIGGAIFMIILGMLVVYAGKEAQHKAYGRLHPSFKKVNG